jgi:hypothetical protein
MRCPELVEGGGDLEEWQAAWIIDKRQKPPEEPPKRGEMVRLIARFGGFLARKGDGHPGPKAQGRAWRKSGIMPSALRPAGRFMRGTAELWVIGWV